MLVWQARQPLDGAVRSTPDSIKHRGAAGAAGAIAGTDGAGGAPFTPPCPGSGERETDVCRAGADDGSTAAAEPSSPMRRSAGKVRVCIGAGRGVYHERATGRLPARASAPVRVVFTGYAKHSAINLGPCRSGRTAPLLPHEPLRPGLDRRAPGAESRSRSPAQGLRPVRH